jgi:carbamoyltransferase
MNVLGINSVYHELSAALVVDGKVVAAVEEERFNRRKHGKPANVDNPHLLPTQSIDFCLRVAGIDAQQLDAVCYSFDPVTRQRTFRLDKLSRKGDWGSREGEETFLNCLDKVPRELSEFLGRDVTRCFHWIPHHLAHAASAYYPSGFDDAAILVVDGIGEHASTIMAAGRGKSIKWLRDIQYPHSLGFLWEKMSKFLSFSEYDACKVMGLAGYGDAAAVNGSFNTFLKINPDGFQLDPEVLEFRLDSFRQLEKKLGKMRRDSDPLEDRHAHIAAALQTNTNQVILKLVEDLYEKCPSDALCLAGGVALNCTTNWLVKEKGPFRYVYIPPAPHDAGTAIGAALYVYFVEANSGAVTHPSTEVMDTAFLGPEYSDEEIAAFLQAENIPAERRDDIAHDVASLIAEGKVVGWFQGRMEFGPRALGNRSLLADPRDRETRERLNRKVKHREDFRPFAPSVIEERCADWFEVGRQTQSHAYMLIACPVKPDKLDLIPAVVHVDATARVQVVTQKQNPKYHRLISHFEKMTGVPLVLNTSFNDSEPIVCSPGDALNTFRGTEIDALALGNYLIRRSNGRNNGRNNGGNNGRNS